MLNENGSLATPACRQAGSQRSPRTSNRLLQAIDYSRKTVFEQQLSEIDQKAKLQSAELKVSEELFLIDRMNLFAFFSRPRRFIQHSTLTLKEIGPGLLK